MAPTPTFFADIDLSDADGLSEDDLRDLLK